jgi:hypothetical protein
MMMWTSHGNSDGDGSDDSDSDDDDSGVKVAMALALEGGCWQNGSYNFGNSTANRIMEGSGSSSRLSSGKGTLH